MRVFAGVLIAVLAAREASAVDFAGLVGNYRLSPDHTLAIAEWEVEPGSPHVLVFTDLRTGRIGVLTEAGKDEVTLATGLMSGDEAARLRFARVGGRVVALTLSEPGKQPRRAERIANRSEEIAIDADSTRLRGTLWLPPGKGPFPAVVLVSMTDASAAQPPGSFRSSA